MNDIATHNSAHLRSAIGRELRPMLRLAWPLVLAELGWMAMSIVDTIMVGHLPRSAVSIGSVAMASVLYNTVAFGIGGVLLGLDTFISQAFGAGRISEANRWLWHGLVLAMGLSVLLIALVALWPFALAHMQMDPMVRAGANAVLIAFNWSSPLLLLYFVLRRHLQAFNHVRAIAVALVTANLINLGFDWLLIFPHRFGAWYFSGWGVAGSGWSTSYARLYLAAFMVAAVLHAEHREKYRLLETKLAIQWSRIRSLIVLGAPAGGQILIEIAIFSLVAAAIATLGPLQLAGHQIALDCAATTYMVPFAISAATSVRVGQAIGRRDAIAAAAAGWTGMLLGAGFMLCASLVFVSMPRMIVRGFTPDPALIATAVPLLLIAAVFQFFDGLQVTATGALRGAGNTHAGMLMHGLGYWVVGTPLGLWLCFRLHWGAVGMWCGLCTALILAGIGLMMIWRSTVRRLPQIVADAHAAHIDTQLHVMPEIL